MAATNDMTKGNITSLIIKFFIPTFLGNMFQQLYNMVDAIIVGKYVGDLALGAVGSTGTIMFLMLGTSTGITSGFCVLTGQTFGAENYRGTKKSVASAFILSLICSVVFTVVSMSLLPTLLRMMKTPDDIYDYAYSYISVIALGITVTIIYNLFSMLLRAVGNSKVPVYALVISSVLNIIFDFVFIVGFKMETAGAALATVISQGISAVLCFIYILRKVPVLCPDRSMFRPEAEYIKKQLATGLPMGLQFGITASGTVIQQSAFNQFGSTAIASFAAISKVTNLFTQADFAIGQTMSSFVGQNFGTGAFKRIRDGVSSAFKMSILYNLVAGIVLILTLPYILPIFFPAGTDVSVYIEWTRLYVIACDITFIFLTMIFIYRSALNSMSHPLAATSIGIAELGARMVISFVSISLASLTVVSFTDAASWTFGGITAVIMYFVIIKKDEIKFTSQRHESSQPSDNK